MMHRSGLLFGLALVGAGALLMVALPHDSDAAIYWSVGLPTTTTAGPIQPTTVISATNAGSLSTQQVTFEKAGTAIVAGTIVNPAMTGQYAYGELYLTTQISNAATYTATTPDNNWEVMQITAVQGTSATTDATKLLPESKLGKVYSVATAANNIQYLNPQPAFFTVIAIKASTTVTVTVSAPTSASVALPPAPTAVPVMTPGTVYTYTLANRGDALHVMGKEGDVKCTVWPFSSPDPLGCGALADLTGSRITCSTACAVFAGSVCVDLEDDSCDTINEEMLPDSLAGQVYVMCAAASNMSGTGDSPAFTDDGPGVDWLRIRAVSGTANIQFAVPDTSGITTASVTSTTWRQFRFVKDTAITSDAPIHVVQYLAHSRVSQTVSPTQNPTSAYQAIGWYGDPAIMELSPLDLSVKAHWFYADPSWENHLYIGYASTTALTLYSADPTGVLSIVSLPPTGRPIGSSGYSCMTPKLPASTASSGGTFLVQGDFPIVAQLTGLGADTAYMYDTGGGNPLVIPPPPPPPASWKWIQSGCGLPPVFFSDTTAPLPNGGAVIAWDWSFGDGGTSTDQSPMHEYQAAGDYIVTLTVMDANGNTGTMTQIIGVVQNPPCLKPTISQDNGQAPRPPHDGVDPAVAGSDVDGDGWPNAVDDCVFIADPGQADLDLDGKGDVCDADRDNDAIVNAADDCPDNANPTQADLDGNGLGDACDPDIDGDTVANGVDNCPYASNLQQDDLDRDGVGDVCQESRFLAAGSGPSAATPDAVPAGLASPAPSKGAWLSVILGAAAAAALIVALMVVLLRRRS
ncbi:MAG: thrombospondin type 3 repeat-containing protein [bacterium]